MGKEFFLVLFFGWWGCRTCFFWLGDGGGSGRFLEYGFCVEMVSDSFRFLFGARLGATLAGKSRDALLLLGSFSCFFGVSAKSL